MGNLIHTCSSCNHAFLINKKTLLSTGWGRSLQAGFKRPSQQLVDYQKVQCPQCGHIEKDERILSYGLFRPQAVAWLVLALMFIMLIISIFNDFF